MYVYSYFVTSSMFEKNYFFCIFDGVILVKKLKLRSYGGLGSRVGTPTRATLFL